METEKVMVSLTTKEFDEVCAKIAEEAQMKGLETGKKLRDISVKHAKEVAVNTYERALQGFSLPEELHLKLAEANSSILDN